MGTGKTTLAKSLVRQLNAHRTYIVDVCGEYGALASDRVIVQPFYDEDDPWRMAVEAWDQATPARKTLLVFDEMEFYGKRKEDDEWLSKLYLVGRHWGVSVIAIGKRFLGKGKYEGLPALPRSQSSSYYLFQVTEPRDLQFLRSYMSQETVERVMALRLPDPKAGVGGEFFKIDF